MIPNRDPTPGKWTPAQLEQIRNRMSGIPAPPPDPVPSGNDSFGKVMGAVVLGMAIFCGAMVVSIGTREPMPEPSGPARKQMIYEMDRSGDPSPDEWSTNPAKARKNLESTKP